MEVSLFLSFETEVGQTFSIKVLVYVLVTSHIWDFCDRMAYSPPGFSVHGFSSVNTGVVVMPLSRKFSLDLGSNPVLDVSGRFFTI